MKSSVLALLFLWGWTASANGSANLSKEGIALDGYDAVSYFKSDNPQKGESKFQVKEDDATYLFSNETNKQEFLKDPKKYEPQFGGWCAYAVSESKSKVDIDPKSFVIQDGRLLLFYNGIWANTREKWLHTKDKSPEIYLKNADANWPSVKTKEP